MCLSFQCFSCQHTCLCTVINLYASLDLAFNCAKENKFLGSLLALPSLGKAGNITSYACSLGRSAAEESGVTVNWVQRREHLGVCVSPTGPSQH